ncbi:malonate transporter [Halobacteriales archaeon QS_4_69_31]|nr:MAG: malonate transporter [Halobacteriales archaeon QS_4_69_31]
MSLLWRLGSLLGLLAVGVGARQVGLLDERRTRWLTALAFYVALPALVFGATYDQRAGTLVSPALVVGVTAVFATMAGVAWAVHRRHPTRARRSVAIVQSYHSNLGFLGVPLVAATLGEAATAVASVVLGISLLLQVPLTVVALVGINEADASVRVELAALARNPVLLALAAGLAAAAVDLAVPAAVDGALGVLGALALPVALLGVGASLRVDLADLDAGATGSVVALKVGLMPAVAWAVFSVLAVSRAAFAATVLLFGMPSAVSTYVYASELGGDARFASVNVFTTTVASLVTIAVILQVVG